MDFIPPSPFILLTLSSQNEETEAHEVLPSGHIEVKGRVSSDR